MRYFFLVVVLFLSACGNFPKTPGEENTGFEYVAVDPLTVSIQNQPACSGIDVTKLTSTEILNGLPDNTARLAISEFTAGGKISFAVGSASTEGGNYEVILDYVATDTVNIPIFIQEEIDENGDRISITIVRNDDMARLLDPGRPERFEVDIDTASYYEIPVYIGVGLRLTANIHSIEGGVQLTSLFGVAAEAEAENVSGTLVVQTLGVTGNKVATLVPLPSKLDTSTIQNAIVAIGSIKATMYDDTNTVITPRVVGFRNQVVDADQELTSLLYSELAAFPIEWRRPCRMAS